MTKVYLVKSARKECKDTFTGETIKVGESYYWWNIRFQGRKISKNPPKSGQLTQSEFWQTVYGIQEEIEALVADETIIGKLGSIKDEIDTLKDETGDKLNNIPDNLQNSQTAELLQSRVNLLQAWYDNFDGIDTDIDSELNEEEKNSRYQEILDEIRSQTYEDE